jgi:hypothetical protein
MAKKTSKRREWTKDDIRELKTLARQTHEGEGRERILRPKKGPDSVSLAAIRKAIRAVHGASD